MRICLLLVLCLPAFAQTTTVTGTIRDPAGDPLAGSCSIQAVGPFTAAAGWPAPPPTSDGRLFIY
jgi:hypothetical protein